MSALFTNFAYSTLQFSITAVQTTLTVASGQGARFPSPTAGDYFYLTLEDASLNREIVKVTARATDVLTIVRGQESTTGFAFTAGASAALRITAQGIVDIATGNVQNSAAQYITSVAGTSTITGSLNPVLSAYTAGQKFHFVAAGANTGAVTLNINSLGAKAVTKTGANALTGGELAAGAAYEVLYDGTEFQLVGAGFASTSAAQTFTAPQRAGSYTANTGTLDCAQQNNFSITPAAGITLTPSNMAAGQSGYILLVNPSGYTIAKAATVKCPSTMLTTVSSSGTYLLGYYSDGSSMYVTGSTALT